VVSAEGIGLFLRRQEDCGIFGSVVQFFIIRGKFNVAYNCDVSSGPNLEQEFLIGFY